MAQVILWSGVEGPVRTKYPVRTGGAYQLAAWLRNHGYTVEVIDFCFMLKPMDIIEITRRHIDSKTIAVGVSTSFWTIQKVEQNGLLVGGVIEPEWLQTARDSVEQSFPNLKWILGGANHGVKSKFNWVRFKDHAEDSVLKWLDEQTGRLITRPQFDIKSYLKLHTDSDFIQPTEVLPIELGRGCIFRCKFCNYALTGKKPGTYTRSFDDIRTEMMINYDRFGITKYYLTDDTVNDSTDKVQTILDLAKSLPFELEWQGYCRADMIWSDFKTADMLRDSGLRSPFFGIETFNPVSSKIISKGWSGKHGKDFLLKLKDHWKSDLSWHIALIYGFPGWTYEEAIEDTNWLIENDMYAWLSWALYINPNGVGYWQSEFDKNAAKYGYEFEGNNRVNWRLGDLKHEEVSEFALTEHKRSIPHHKIGGFRLGELSSALKCSMKSLVNVKESTLDHDLIVSNTESFIKGYVQNHLNRN